MRVFVNVYTRGCARFGMNCRLQLIRDVMVVLLNIVKLIMIRGEDDEHIMHDEEDAAPTLQQLQQHADDGWDKV